MSSGVALVWRVMATLQIVTAFPASTAFMKPASVAGVRGYQERKTLRVSCERSVVPADVDGSDSDGAQEAVNILQSSRNPLLNLLREDLMAALVEKEHHTNGADGVVAPAGESSGQRRRSERVIFTAEKARLLRKENRATRTFHDKWYHSAIASKLAMPE